MNIELLEFGQWVHRWLKADFDMAPGLNSGQPDPDFYLFRYFTTDGNLNFVTRTKTTCRAMPSSMPGRSPIPRGAAALRTAQQHAGGRRRRSSGSASAATTSGSSRARRASSTSRPATSPTCVRRGSISKAARAALGGRAGAGPRRDALSPAPAPRARADAARRLGGVVPVPAPRPRRRHHGAPGHEHCPDPAAAREHARLSRPRPSATPAVPQLAGRRCSVATRATRCARASRCRPRSRAASR